MGEAFILFSCKQCRGLWYVDVPYLLYDIFFSIYIHNKNAYDKKQQSTLECKAPLTMLILSKSGISITNDTCTETQTEHAVKGQGNTLNKHHAQLDLN